MDWSDIHCRLKYQREKKHLRGCIRDRSSNMNMIITYCRIDRNREAICSEQTTGRIQKWLCNWFCHWTRSNESNKAWSLSFLEPLYSIPTWCYGMDYDCSQTQESKNRSCINVFLWLK